jgi:RecA-family ATPase
MADYTGNGTDSGRTHNGAGNGTGKHSNGSGNGHAGTADPNGFDENPQETEALRQKYRKSKQLWTDVRLADWAGRWIPPREWIMEDWIPRTQCIGLYGISGVLKTLFLLQLLMAASLGLPFCGRTLARVPTYGLFCEDETEEILRRAHRIAAFYERDLSEFTDFHFASLVGVQDTEFLNFDSGRRMLGPAYHLFDGRLTEYKSGLAALDVLPDFFGGEEVNRRQASSFIRMLDGVSITHKCAVVFTAHPSQRGRASGRLDSGSTGWEGKTRGRLTLHDPGDDADADAAETPDQRDLRISRNPTDKRILTRAASNYARPGETIELVIRDGAFAITALDPTEAKKRGPLRDLEVDAKFLELIGKVKATGVWVNDTYTQPNRYAPTVFSRHPDRGTITKSEFENAMPRLMSHRRIRLVRVGNNKTGHMELEIV